MAGIDVKMGVSGLSEFKNNLNAAKNSLKTMDAQLELTEKEFKATGDAEKYLQDKAVELNAKLEMQKTVLKNAEGALEEMTRNGVDKGSKAFQDMQQNVLKAKSAMIDTQAEIDKLGTESTDAAKEADKMNTQLERIGSQVSFETVHNGLKRITDGM
jgi:chromosome segregation ATPase